MQIRSYSEASELPSWAAAPDDTFRMWAFTAGTAPQLLDSEATKEGVARAEKENWRLDIAEPDFMPDPEYKGKGLQLLFTVEDEGVFTMPWSATITYRRPLVGEWQEYVCAENRNKYYDGKDAEVPTADKPDF